MPALSQSQSPVVESRLSLETKLRRLWDADVLGIVNASLDGRILDANDTFLRTIGYARAELEAGLLAWPGLVSPDGTQAVAAATTELLRSGHVGPVEMDVFHKAGHRVPILYGAATIPDGGEAECLAFVHDLTVRKQLEAQLLQAQRLESVGLLAGGIAHDLNNVLSVILLYGQCAQDQLGAEDPARGDLDEIRRAAESARGITRQLLAFSRQQVLQPTVIELGGVALGLETMLRRLLGEDIQLTVHATASRRVLADLGQLEQVLMNLLVNARDAMPDGGMLSIAVLDLEVSIDDPRAGLPAGRYVELRVTDTGAGMDAATLQRIFEPFFTTKEKSRGTGLGLATVFGIVKQSGGGVWVDSAPGHGSTFHVALPAIKSTGGRVRSVTSGNLRRATRGETVLVVDDELAIGRGLKHVLEKAGYRALVVGGPGDALLVAEREGDRIDVLVTDIVMPMLSGPRLSERLRASRPRLRTLFISGYADTVAAERSGTFEPLTILPKPFTGAELLAKLRALLDDEPT